ncbi:MAG: NAD-dependent epimerase/dehydratase family protein [Sedimentisphaerales bacterium]|nr:NAD-dependent epimerase/dehydratase family protein [Sedimentisphaerales bacterium]
MPAESNEIIALVGGTGPMGKSIAAALRKEGQRYRVIGRSQTKLAQTFGDDPLAQTTEWDPDDEQSIRNALRGCGGVVHLLGVPYTSLELHPFLMRRVLDAALAEKADRLLLIGTLYVYGRAQSEHVTEAHPREPHTFKGHMRKAQEDLVLEAHASGRIRTTILRLPDFYGPNVSNSLINDLFVAAGPSSSAQSTGRTSSCSSPTLARSWQSCSTLPPPSDEPGTWAAPASPHSASWRRCIT